MGCLCVDISKLSYEEPLVNEFILGLALLLSILCFLTKLILIFFDSKVLWRLYVKLKGINMVKLLNFEPIKVVS